jgi:hypothetical protein
MPRGNVTRQANKKLRRLSVLDMAKTLITTEGFEAFTLTQLAKDGKWHDVILELRI